MTVNVDMKALFEAGAHFGHKTSRWHPKMAPYIHSKREGAHIINLDKTVEGLDKALAFAADTVKNGKKILSYTSSGTTVPVLSCAVTGFDAKGKTLFCTAKTRPHDCALELPEAAKYSVVLTDVYGREKTYEI